MVYSTLRLNNLNFVNFVCGVSYIVLLVKCYPSTRFFAVCREIVFWILVKYFQTTSDIRSCSTILLHGQVCTSNICVIHV